MQSRCEAVGEATTEVSADQPGNDEWVSLSEIEGRYVARVLQHTRGNKQAAARILEVDRKTLDRMIKRHHIDAQSARAPRVKASSDALDAGPGGNAAEGL